MSEITPNTPNPVREDSYTTELATKLGIDPKYIPISPVWRTEEEIAAIAEMFSNMAGASSGGGVLVVNATFNGTGVVCDKTAVEMMSAAQTGLVIIKTPRDVYTVIRAHLEDGYYTFFVYDNVGMSFEAESGTDYPIFIPE